MSQTYGKGRELYKKLKKQYLENKMHPSFLDLLKAGKITFKDDTIDIPENEIEDKEKLE